VPELPERERDGDDWQDVFQVHGRAGAECPRRGAPIARAVIGGRTTAFSRRCQLRPGRGAAP